MFYIGNGDISKINTAVECSNEYCRKTQENALHNVVNQRLFTAARQMEDDVSKHILRDNPHGDQVTFLYIHIYN